ncbi:hypothetical protein Pryu01_01545 [Paraliobacillus ryukyuensis]|uniref:Acetyltransferase (GNAT) family protein n=1 Tax=Paraliobacillus ryukyuensis TaxID=200904 RepID=A0A366EEP2_9BACI|nr:GNAT family N-acetyltransferase [Paraliobacillus ryukyuensis]RBO99888.1 acetyltransferase (GNAT) family protein [Paraliobacillus ryukyuensis]
MDQTKISISLLTSERAIRDAFTVMSELRGHLDEETYVALVKEAQGKDQYHLAALYYQNKIVAAVGFKPMITLYYGRFVWVNDLVTTASMRSHGLGETLLRYVENWALAHGYEAVALSSGLQRTDAHRFYEQKMAYDRVSYVFKKVLNNN